MTGNHYRLTCVYCQKEFKDTNKGFLLTCDEDHSPALLRASYSEKKLIPHDHHPGIFHYKSWLPVRRILPQANAPIVYRSDKLAGRLRLENLLIVFNGYWPEKGAGLSTCSFKELEALPVCARIPDGEDRTLVVSSAGNTGRAFLQVGSENAVPVLVVVPESALPNMWLTVEKHPAVTLAVLKGRSDYFDAIQLGNMISQLDEYYPEGGAKNVARRDGLGTVLLTAVEEIGEIPAHYIQAVGSGTGGIAVWEMNARLIEDGRFGNQNMKLHFVQNEPFTVITDSWQHSSPQLIDLPEEEARDRIARMHAPILSNRTPPYSIRGGVFDALTDSDGYMYSVTNREAKEAGHIFEQLEGCDLDPAAEVALAGLFRAVKMKRIEEKELVLLNVTGGGRNRLAKEKKMRFIEPDVVFTPDALTPGAVNARLSRKIKELQL